VIKGNAFLCGEEPSLLQMRLRQSEKKGPFTCSPPIYTNLAHGAGAYSLYTVIHCDFPFFGLTGNLFRNRASTCYLEIKSPISFVVHSTENVGNFS
jgi:hypothetical protein